MLMVYRQYLWALHVNDLADIPAVPSQSGSAGVTEPCLQLPHRLRQRLKLHSQSTHTHAHTHTRTHTHTHTHRAVVVARDKSAIKQGEIRSRARDARENLRIQFAILFLPHIPCQQIALNWIALIQGSVSGCITEEQMEYFQWEGRKILEKRAKMEWPGGKKKKKAWITV